MNIFFKVNLLVRINNSSENEKSLDADFKENFWQKRISLKVKFKCIIFRS